MGDAAKARTALVVRVDNVPWCNLGISGSQHFIAGARIVIPAPMGLEVHRAELPDFPPVVDPRDETAGLLFLADFKPVFDQDNSRANERFFHRRTHLKEVTGLLLGTKAHHALD